MSFHYNGEFLAYNTATTLSILHLNVKHIRKFDYNVTKHGCGIVKFFETDPIRLVHSSPDHSLRFLNAECVKYISYFAGHSKKVVNIDVTDNFFFSSSHDKTIRMWDRCQQESVKRILCLTTPLIALHPSGNLLAVATKSSSIEFLDMRNLDDRMKKFKFEKVEGVEWTGIKFSPDGRMLLVTTNSTSILVFDTTDGTEKRNWKGEVNKLWKAMLKQILRQTIATPTRKRSTPASHRTPNSSSPEAPRGLFTFVDFSV